MDNKVGRSGTYHSSLFKLNQSHTNSKFFILFFAVVLALAMWSIVPARVVRADTITVTLTTPDDGTTAGTLRWAILTANSDDVINITATGTITLSALGPLTVTKDLTIHGPGSALLAVSGNNITRVLEIDATSSLSLSQVTIRDGNAGAGFGGGISNWGTLTLTQTSIVSNTAARGGGIVNGSTTNRGVLVVNNSVVSENTCTQHGAGIYNLNSTATLNDTTVSSNTADLSGGGIYSLAAEDDANLYVNNCTIIGNIGEMGAFGGGGGLRAYGSTHAATTVVKNTTISGNRTNEHGGGIKNIADPSGGSVADMILDHCTVVDNVADTDDASGGTGGGIYNLLYSGTGTASIVLSNTILANNTQNVASPTANDFSANGSFTVQANYNIVEFSTNITLDGTGNLTGDQPNLNLGPLADNGGPETSSGSATWTHALLPGSPAIDAIPPVSCTLTGDQRGVTRPQGVNCDIGAYEASVDLSIAKTVDPMTPLAPGDSLTYVLAFSNADTYTATGVVITDILPVALTNIITDYSGVEITATTGMTYVWEVQDLPYNAAGLITVTGVVKEPWPAGTVVNTATIATAVDDLAPDNNTSAIIVTVQNVAPVASDSAFSTDEDTPLHAALVASDANGDVLTYGIMTPPVSGAILITDVTQGDFIYTPTHQMATYDDTFTFVVTDTLGLTDTAVVTITVTADADADVQITKVVDPASAIPGQPVTYTLVFTNNGPETAPGVLVTDYIPISVTQTSVISSGVGITRTGAITYSWEVEALAPGARGMITITGVLSDPLPTGPFTNTATITTTAVDAMPANDTDQAGLTVIEGAPVSDLVITKFADPEPVIAGETLTYTVVITNAGTLPADNVTLSDTLHFSTTLQPVDQTDDDASLLGFGGGTYDNTRWYDPRPTNPNANKWLEMIDPTLSTGVYTSRVMDATSYGPWTTLEWLPRRPYWKPLPDNGATETGYPLGRADMFGNRVLLHLDNISYTAYSTMMLPIAGVISDTSGSDLPVTCPAEEGAICPAMVSDGRFNAAASFNGALDETIVISDPVDAGSYALELWVRPTIITDTSFILRANVSGTQPISGTDVYVSHLLGIYNGQFIHAMTDEGGATTMVASPASITADTWYHVVGTGRANGTLRLYVNGEETESISTMGMPWTGGDHYRLGSSYGLTLVHGITGTAQYYTGDMDEVAIYTRTLSPDEVMDHYLRGALRLSFQVRSCDDAGCVGEDFVGPGGLNTTTYSELDNMTPALPLMALSGVPDNRYFQYRMVLESDAAPYGPEIRRVRVEPEDRAAIVTSQGVCVASAGDSAFSCDLGTLASGEVVTIVTQLGLDPSLLGVITNTATVTSTTSEASSTNNTATVTSTVIGQANLDVRKGDGRAYANLGSIDTFYIEALNTGPSTAYDVMITDTLSSGLIGYPTGLNGWTCGAPGNTITCTAASLNVGIDQYDWQPVAQITTTIPFVEGMITNTVWLTSTLTPVSTTTEISDTDTTFATILADMTVDKWAHTAPVMPGETLTYTVVITNTGPEPANDVVVTDTLPAGLIGYPVYDPLVWSSCSAPANEISCVLSDTLAVDQSASFDITVTAPISGFLENYAVVDAREQDDDLDDNDVTLYVGVLPVAELAISKSDDPDPVDATAPLTYTLTVTNTGPVVAGQYESTLTFTNRGWIGIPVPNSTAWAYPSRININSVPGAIENITVTLYNLHHTYPGDLSILLVGPDGQDVMLMENAGGGRSATGVNLTFNQAATQTLPVSDTLMSGVPYRPTSYNFGLNQDLPGTSGRPYGTSLGAFEERSPNGQWRLYVFDNVPESDGGSIRGGWSLELTTVTDDEVVVTDTLPTDLNEPVNVAASPDWSCSLVGNQVTCRADSFNVGQPAEFTIQANAPDNGGVITNTASISSTTADLDWADNTATITTTVIAIADLDVVKQVDPPTVPMGHPLTYTLAVNNFGPSDVLDGVTLTDTLPDGLSAITVTGDGWMCDTSGLPVFTCTLSSLALGAAPMITVTADAPMMEGVITNTATITSGTFDDDVLNNSSTVTSTVAERSILDLMAFNDSPTVLGNATHFTATVADGTNVVYEWNFDNGVTQSGNPVAYTYPMTGTYMAVVTATNTINTLTATTWVTITEALLPVLSIDSVSASEGDGVMTFTVSLSAPSALDVAVDYETADSTATGGADYVGATDRVTLTAGSLSTTMPVTILDDAIEEPDETFTVTLSNPLNATLAVAEGVGTIVDDDTAGITVTPLTVMVAEGGITDTYTLVLESEPAADVSVTVAPDAQVVVDATALTFTDANWDVPQTLVVTAVDDAVSEPTPHFGFITHTLTSGDVNYDGAFEIVVTAVITNQDNMSPIAVDDAYTTTENVVLVVAAPGVLENDTDAEMDPLTATLDMLPLVGTLDFAADGSFVYTPTLDSTGVVTFTYHVTDGNSQSNVATVTLNVVTPPTYAIYLPLVMRNYVVAPDLVVESLTVTSNMITLVIRNQGDLPVEVSAGNEFWVDVYIGPCDRGPQTVNETWRHLCGQGAVWGVTVSALPLDPGESLTLTAGASGGPYSFFFPEHSVINWPIPAGTQVWAQVDSADELTNYGAVLETHEFYGGVYNNIFGPVSSTAGSGVVEMPVSPAPVVLPDVNHHLPKRP